MLILLLKCWHTECCLIEQAEIPVFLDRVPLKPEDKKPHSHCAWRSGVVMAGLVSFQLMDRISRWFFSLIIIGMIFLPWIDVLSCLSNVQSMGNLALLRSPGFYLGPPELREECWNQRWGRGTVLFLLVPFEFHALWPGKSIFLYSWSCSLWRRINATGKYSPFLVNSNFAVSELVMLEGN